MKELMKSALIQFLEGADSIMKAAGEDDFAELKRRDKQAIFDLFVDSGIEYDIDGDGDGCYLLANFDDCGITFYSHGEYMCKSEIRDSLYDLYIRIGEAEELSIPQALAEIHGLPSGEKIKKLNDLLKKCNVSAFGFPAFAALSALSNQNSNMKVILSTLSPGENRSKGISSYIAPVLPRGVIFNSPLDVVEADIDVNFVSVHDGISSSDCEKILIVSRHQGTIDILKSMYPEADILSGNVSANDISGAFVAGTLPPHLVAHCKSYQAVTIKNFDYNKDGDLSGTELQERMIIHEPIAVEISDLYIK